MTILNRGNTDSEARLIEIQGDPQHAGFKLVRQWERQYAPSVDTLAVAVNDCTYYTDPGADKQTYTGTFIQSSLEPVARTDDSIDLRQTLTKVKFATAEADADIVTQIGDPAVDGYELSRAWHYIDPYSLDTLFPAVNAVEYVTNPLGNTDSLAGKFIVSRVRSAEQTDRTYDIIQDMVKVKTITTDTGLDANLTDPLIDRAKDIIHPFGEGTGVGRDIVYRYINLDPASDTKLMAVADTKLVAKMSQNDSFIHVARKSTTEQNRTLTFWVLAQRKQREAWGSRYATPDHIEDQSPGRDNTIRRKFWYGIDNDDYTTVKSQLENPTSVDTGFSLLGFSVRDNDDGSDNWTQTTIRQFNDTQTDSKFINTHGIEYNVLKIKQRRYDNYYTEPATPAVDTGYRPESVKVWKDERGLISKRVVYTLPAPSNTTTDGQVDSYTLGFVRNGDHDDIDGAGIITQRTHDQVPLADVDSIMRTMDATTDSTFIVSSLDYTDIGNGAARIDQTRKLINSNACWYIEEIGSSNNGSNKSINRVWPLVTDTKAQAIIESGEATDSFQFDGDWYVHRTAHRTKHFDGTSTIRQRGSLPASLVSTGGEGGGAIWVGGGVDSELIYKYIPEVGLQEEVIVYQKTYSNFDSAIAFADRGDDFLQGNGIMKLGRVDLQGEGSWLAKKVVRKP